MRRFFSMIILLMIVSACSSSQADKTFADLPTGDAERGALLFEEMIAGAPKCSSCHLLTDAVSVGPGFAEFSQRAGNAVEGLSAEEYTFQSIVYPAQHLVSGYSNVMYPQYASKLSDQDLADLIAYLLIL